MLLHLKKSLALFATVALAATFGAGCSKSAKSAGAGGTGGAKVSVKNFAVLASSMKLTVGPGTGTPSFTAIVQPMSQATSGVDPEWTGFVSDIPAGNGRTFHIDAYDAAMNVIFTGDATANITAGSTAVVYMMLQQTAPPNGFGNHAPVIDGLTASSALVTPGATVTLTVAAHDPDTATDPNNKIAGYLWTATCGTLTGANTANPTWTAPATDPTTCSINVTVSDVCPADQPAVCSSSVTATLQIMVASKTSGNANVYAYPNNCPAISCVYANEQFTYDANGKVNGYEADLTVNSADVDGDDLHYVWSSACATAVFTPPTPGSNPSGEIVNSPTTIHFKANTTDACNVRVDVTDFWPHSLPPAGSGLAPARGCDNIGTLALSGAQDFQLAPVIVRLVQPNANNQVNAGQTYTFGADVSDPQNAYPITIDWFNDGGSGSFGAQIPGAPYQLAGPGSLQMDWTAPATIVPGMKIRLKITNALGLFTEHVYNIVPANACAGAGSDGLACDTGLGACGPNGQCQSGACVSPTPVVCNAPTDCHVAQGAFCDPSNGQCNYPLAAQNASCNADSNGCTANDACNAAGTCLAGPAPTCATPPNSACYAAAGTCASTGNSSFTCNYTALNAGTTCTPTGSYNHCFLAYSCDGAGTCANPASPVSCTGGQCSTGGTCDPADGICKGGNNQPNGTPCDDSNPCTGNTTVADQCVGGICQPGGDKCQVGQTCDNSGACHPTGVQMDAVRDLQTTTPGAMATDSSGASYVVTGIASTIAVDFDGHSVASFGDTDIFAAKYDPATHLALWATHYGDAANPQLGTGVAVTQDGTVAMIGNFVGSMTFGSNTLNAAATLDFLAAVKGSDGTGKWGKSFNDGSNGKLSAVAANPNSATNRIAVCGIASQAATDLVPGATFGGATDAVVAWFASDGTPVKAFELGGTGNETCNAAAVDDSGNVYFAGQFDGANLTIGGFTLTGPGTTSRKFIWVAKFDGTTGAALAAAAFSGVSAGSATPNSLTADATGKLVIGGQFTSTLVVGGTTLTSAGGADAFVAKVDPAASMAPIWAVRLGGTGTDAAGSVAVTSFGDVVVAGYFNRTTTGAAALTANTTSAPDAFILKLNGATGSTDFSAGYGDAATQTGDSVTVNRFGTNQVAVLGTFGSSITFAPLAPTSAAGGTDVFLAMGHLFSM